MENRSVCQTIPFSGLHGSMATPSSLHTSSTSHSLSLVSRLYWFCMQQKRSSSRDLDTSEDFWTCHPQKLEPPM